MQQDISRPQKKGRDLYLSTLDRVGYVSVQSHALEPPGCAQDTTGLLGRQELGVMVVSCQLVAGIGLSLSRGALPPHDQHDVGGCGWLLV